MEDLFMAFKIKSSLPPWVSELSKRAKSLQKFFEDFKSLLGEVIDKDLFTEVQMGRLLPLTTGHVLILNQKEQEALKYMIIKSGFLRNDKLIPILNDRHEDSGQAGEL